MNEYEIGLRFLELLASSYERNAYGQHIGRDGVPVPERHITPETPAGYSLADWGFGPILLDEHGMFHSALGSSYDDEGRRERFALAHKYQHQFDLAVMTATNEGEIRNAALRYRSLMHDVNFTPSERSRLGIL